MRTTKGETSASPKAALAIGGVVLEQWALARIIATTDLIEVDGRPYLLTPAEPELVDALACVGAEGEDMEDEGVALDWTHGKAVQIAGVWTFPVIIQDGEQEPTQANGGSL